VGAKQVTSTPIVVGLTFDPIENGLAEAYARPNGSVTGIFVDYITLIGKQLELGFEVMSSNKRAGMLVNVNDTTAINNRLRKQVETAADAIAAKLDVFDIRVPTDIEVAFESMARIPVSFGIVPPNPMFLSQRQHIAELAIRSRLPIVYGAREHVEAGG